jgi:hypothetical protein
MKKSKEIKRLRSELQALIKLASALELAASFDKRLHPPRVPSKTVPVDASNLAKLVESLDHARDILEASYELWPDRPKKQKKQKPAPAPQIGATDIE